MVTNLKIEKNKEQKIQLWEWIFAALMLYTSFIFLYQRLGFDAMIMIFFVPAQMLIGFIITTITLSIAGKQISNYKIVRMIFCVIAIELIVVVALIHRHQVTANAVLLAAFVLPFLLSPLPLVFIVVSKYKKRPSELQSNRHYYNCEFFMGDLPQSNEAIETQGKNYRNGKFFLKAFPQIENCHFQNCTFHNEVWFSQNLFSCSFENCHFNGFRFLLSEKDELIDIEKITDFTDITDINIRDVKLQRLPKGINKLTNLTSLVVCDCDLNELPEEMFQLENLEHVDFCSNKLTKIPAAIGKLENLTSLYLAHNQLKAIPMEIAKLSKLKKLNVNYNQIKEFPPQLFKLNLRELGCEDLSQEQKQKIKNHRPDIDFV